jgi:hypothetical protein
MAVDLSVRRSRRALIAAALGGVGALVADALGRPPAVRAGTDGDVILGQTNIAANTTAIRAAAFDALYCKATGGGNTAIYGDASGDDAHGVFGRATSTSGAGVGVWGQGASAAGWGVRGENTAAAAGGAGVYGIGGPGVRGETAVPERTGVMGVSTAGSGYLSCGVYGTTASSDDVAAGVRGDAPNGAACGVVGVSSGTTGMAAGVHGEALMTGVRGLASRMTGLAVGVVANAPSGNPDAYGVSASGAVGVEGRGSGIGVSGTSTSGIGVSGATSGGVAGSFTADTGIALQTSGRVVIGAKRSGKIKVAAGRSSASIAVPGVTSSSLIIATLATNRGGTYVRAAIASSGKVTVYLNKAVTSAAYATYLVLS